MFTRRVSLPFVVACCLVYGLLGWPAHGAEIKAGNEVVTVTAASVMKGKEVLGKVPYGTELTVREIKGEWAGVVWSQNGEEIAGWIHTRNLVGKSDFARLAQQGVTLDAFPVSKQLSNFKPQPQQSGNTCSAAAARNLLVHVTGSAAWEWLLFLEIVREDHKGLAHLEGKLKAIGVDNPMALSAFGGTSVGIKAVVNKRLPDELHCDFQEILKFEDRLLVIVRSINNGWPVIVPVVSSSLQHWITITGYDRRTRTFSTASFGPISFDQFNTLNSWHTIPGGILGRAFQLASEEHMGRCVLVFLTRTEAEE